MNKTTDGSATLMTDKRHWILVTASILTFGLWVGCAAAEDPSQGSSAADLVGGHPADGSSPADLVNVSDNKALGDNEMLAVGTGHGNSLGAVSDPDANVSGNGPISDTTTGGINLASQNSGGINVNFANTGNNVVMQNSMAINVFLGAPQ